MAQISKNVYYVNEGFSQNKPKHEYNNLQSCIDEIGPDEKVLIIVSSDLDNVPELSLTEPRTDITIDAMEHFNIEFQDTICRIREDHTLKFMNMAELWGDTVIMSGNDVIFGLKDIENTDMNITLNSGMDNLLNINNTNFNDITDVVLDIDNRECVININNSYLKGGVHASAILYHVPNNHMIIKNSTLIHGDEMGIPIQVDGTFVPELRLYGCSGSARLCDGTVTNWVVNDNSISNSYIGG